MEIYFLNFFKSPCLADGWRLKAKTVYRCSLIVVRIFVQIFLNLYNLIIRTNPGSGNFFKSPCSLAFGSLLRGYFIPKTHFAKLSDAGVASFVCRQLFQFLYNRHQIIL